MRISQDFYILSSSVSIVLHIQTSYDKVCSRHLPLVGFPVPETGSWRAELFWSRKQETGSRKWFLVEEGLHIGLYMDGCNQITLGK